MRIDTSTTVADRAMVCTVDDRASLVGQRILAEGGNAVDAAIAANAVLAVTAPHMCGLGGDLFALVHARNGPPDVLNASGRAGSNATAGALRDEGFTTVPHRNHLGAVTVPGCVDGWLSLHERFGRTPLAALVAPAIDLADRGFEPTALLVQACDLLGEAARGTDFADVAAGPPVTRPGVARVLRDIATDGRHGFYGGEFGSALLELEHTPFTPDDLARLQADWVAPLGIRLHGHDVWTVPPNSQGYLAVTAAAIADEVGWPDDPETGVWAHLGIEAARAAAFDRTEVLHEHADVDVLLGAARLRGRAQGISLDRAADWNDGYSQGDTMYLCVADESGMAVSLIQSNARDFGSFVVAGETGVWLHNRGIGFSLIDGHPAELAPGRRPPHTLAPALVTDGAGDIRAALGTMGGDAQPQIVLQLLARLLVESQAPGEILGAARWVLANTAPRSGFDTWADRGRVQVWIEDHAPPDWPTGLVSRGHQVEQFDHPAAYGHAHLIVSTETGWAGAADPRSGGSARAV